jgi:spore germination cell wall hydrolase CwlJ-like protein
MKIINILQRLLSEQKVEPAAQDVTATKYTEPGEPKIALDLPKENGGLSNDDLIVAATIYGEAGGEGSNGMKAVANVIRNRADSSGITPKQVVLKKKQFSMWNNKIDDESRVNYINTIESKAKKNKSEQLSWDTAKNLVYSHIKEKGDDNTKGAEFYHTTSIKPNWNWDKLAKTTTIGNHIFYKLKA